MHPETVTTATQAANQTFYDAVVSTAQARKRYAACEAEVRALREEWEQANAALLDRLRVAKEEMQQCENELRTAALAVYEESGDKSLGHGVKVRVMERYHYPDDVALSWAEEHKLACEVVLHKRDFEKLMVAYGPKAPEWFQIESVPTITLPKTFTD